MQVILRKPVESLGDAGDIVDVKAGYGRNYLIPQGFAYEEAQALRALAALAELQGRESEAADALQEAERLMQRVGDNG